MEIPNGIYHIRILIIRTKRRMPEPMLAGSGIWLGGKPVCILQHTCLHLYYNTPHTIREILIL